jgi:hypothetical protein
MTIEEAIGLANAWQEGYRPTPENIEPLANAFAYALFMLDLERKAASMKLTDAGFSEGTLNHQIVNALNDADKRARLLKLAAGTLTALGNKGWDGDI